MPTLPNNYTVKKIRPFCLAARAQPQKNRSLTAVQAEYGIGLNKNAARFCGRRIVSMSINQCLAFNASFIASVKKSFSALIAELWMIFTIYPSPSITAVRGNAAFPPYILKYLLAPIS